MNFSLGVFGHTTLDYIVELDRLPEPNTSIEMAHQERYFGGTGANIARRASRLGVRTFLSSLVGPDMPQDFRMVLEEDGVDISDVRIVEGYLTPMCWVMSDKEHNQIAVINQGPMRDADNFDIPVYSVAESSTIHISTGRPGYYKRVMEKARSLGKKICFDPAQEIHYVYNPEIFMQMLSLSDIFFGNEKEMRTAVSYSASSTVEDLLSFVPIVVETMGGKGSKIHNRDVVLEIPAITPNRVVDTTGAGDAFRAGFHAAMSRGLDLYHCGLYASASGSFAVENMGPQNGIPTWEQLEERLQRFLGRKV